MPENGVLVGKILENEVDHWKPQELKNSGYSILPIEFEDDMMRIKWHDEWNGPECE